MTSNGATSHSGVVTGAEEEPPKPMTQQEKALAREKITGYVFPSATHRDNTPLDFARSPDTGQVLGGGTVFGIVMRDLRTGIGNAVIPCQFIWKRGRWLSDFDPMDTPITEVKPKLLEGQKEPKGGWDWAVWVTHGEGSPGNWAFFAYLLPTEIAANPTSNGGPPRHPMMWKKALKEGNATNFDGTVDADWKTAPPIGKGKMWYQASWELLNTGKLEEMLPRYTPGGVSYGYGYPTYGDQKKPEPNPVAAKLPAPIKTTSAPALPSGVRFRCLCGHWYMESNLIGHKKVCPVAQGEEEATFAIICDDKCGCEMIKDFPAVGYALGHKTLDHVSRPKPGYPRPTPVKEVTMTDETTTEGEATAPDPAPAEEPEAAEAPPEAAPATA